MDVETMEGHAERIAAEILENADYSYVTEDEALEHATEDEWRMIHAMIQKDVFAVMYP